jgi:hypothetical protein
MAQLFQVLAFALAAVLAVAHCVGLIGASIAFFLACAIGALYTGNQLLSRLDMSLGAAMEAVLARPESRVHAWTYWVYLATLAVLAGLIVEILAGH